MMTRLRRRLGWLVIVAASLWGGVTRAELIPTPEFADHHIPTAELPISGDGVGPIVDVAVLVGFLALASYLALVVRSRRYLWWLTVAAVLWFGFWREGCVCPIGATQNVSLAMADPTYVVPMAVVAFFVVPLLFSLFFGRTFCAAVCPLGAVQELVTVRPIQLPRWLGESLGVVPFLYLGVAVIFAATGTGFVICRYDPFVALFRLSGNSGMLVFGGAMLVLGVFVGRPYCRFLCPYGALLRITSRLAQWRVRITPAECLQCRLCENVCPYGAIHASTHEQSPTDRARGKRQLLVVLAATPLLLAVCTWSGRALALPLSQWHGQVQLAEQVRAEELGLSDTKSDASEAFALSGRSREELYALALDIRAHFQWLGLGLGAWFGVVLAAKLLQLSLRRRRPEFQADHSACFACGRCYWYCPVEQVRLGLITDTTAIVARVAAEQEAAR